MKVKLFGIHYSKSEFLILEASSESLSGIAFKRVDGRVLCDGFIVYSGYVYLVKDVIVDVLSGFDAKVFFVDIDDGILEKIRKSKRTIVSLEEI